MKLEWLNIVYFTNINMQNKISYLNVDWGLCEVRGKNVRNKETYLFNMLKIFLSKSNINRPFWALYYIYALYI